MARVQLSLNVSDLDASVDFYRCVFGVEPAKLRPGYANFVVDDPPLKLVLNAPGNGAGGTINHLGVEMESAADVAQATARLAAERLEPTAEDETGCCYALQTKAWVHDPDGAPWEIYAVLADLDTPTGEAPTGEAPTGEAGDASACCSA